MMNNKITHGKVCRKMEINKTQTPVPVANKPDTLEPTITLNFYVGSVCSEEIIGVEMAKELLEKLQEILSTN